MSHLVPAPRSALFLAFLAACDTPVESQIPGAVVVDLTPREMLIRLSVDLRGVHPSEADLASFESAPTDVAYEGYADTWMRDDRFLDRMEELWNLTFRTRTGDVYFDPNEAGLGGMDTRDVADSIGEEPLQLARYLIANDLPWTDILLADHTMADETLAAMWGLDRQGEGDWVPAYYRDGRPMAGVLSMTTTWQRYPSAGSNANRHRANNLSRMFLCDDYLSRPVEFSRADVEAATTEELEDVIRTNPTCVGCHSSLDPLAAHFYGFWWDKEEETLASRTRYYAGDEGVWQSYAGRAPNYYGTPTAGLRDLAERIAADSRFRDCTVKTMFEAISQREATDADWSEMQAHRAAFEAGGLRMKPLIKSIVTAEGYKNPVDTETISSVKMVSPEQLRTIVADKTTYEWDFEGRSGLGTNDLGLPVLMGGVDSRYVTDRNFQPTVSAMFVQERLAQVAGYRIAASDLAGSTASAPILLQYVAVTDTPDANADAFAEQVRFLYLHLTGIPLAAGAPEVQEGVDLWKQVFSVTSSPTSSWAAVIAAVLRDPNLLFY